MSKDNIITKTESFDVIERNGAIGIADTDETIMILPFVTDDKGLPLMLGVIKEANSFREGGNAISIITAKGDDEDPNYITTAKRELKEKIGFDITDDDKWYFLGSVTGSKFVDAEYPCFGVDITGVVKNEISVTDEMKEKLVDFTFIPANDVVKTKDVFIPTLFLKLFKFVVGMDLYNRDDSTFSKLKGFNIEI